MAEQLSRATDRAAEGGGPYRQVDQEAAKPSYWAVLPAAIRYDPEIPASAKLLYAEISALTDQRGFCWASNAYFERLYDLSERTIVRLIRALENAGYIRILDAGGGSARRKIAAGINPLAGTPDKNVSTPLTKMSVLPDKNVRENSKEIRKENDPPVAPKGAEAIIWDEPAWERFWAMYPRKVDKAKAIRAWNRLKADRKLMQTMSAALKAQKASEEWRRDNGRAIPYPSTWLNNRRWEDEVDGRAAEGVGPYRTDDREEDDVLRI